MAASSSRTAPLHYSTERQGEEIDIFLKVMRTVALKVKRSEMIKDLKALLHDKYGYPENHQELFLGGDMLVDYQSLVECGVQRDTTLHLILEDNVGIKLFVKVPSCQSTIEIEAKLHDTIQNIKSMIQAKKKIIPLDQFTLVFGGQLLEEDSTLALLGIKDESTLQMIRASKDNLSISVKVPSGETVKLKIRALFTVSDVKSIVGSITCVSMSGHNLIFSEKKLENHRT